MKHGIATASLLVALAISTQLSAQTQPANTHGEAKLIEFDAPGAATESTPACAPICGTFVAANNNWGEIAGYYRDKSNVLHGFFRRTDGHFDSFEAPGAGKDSSQGTAPSALNDLGMIAGSFNDSNLIGHAFIRHADGTFTVFEAPGAGTGANQGTYATSINLDGDTAGNFNGTDNVGHGFLRYRDGEMTIVDPPGSRIH